AHLAAGAAGVGGQVGGGGDGRHVGAVLVAPEVGDRVHGAAKAEGGQHVADECGGFALDAGPTGDASDRARDGVDEGAVDGDAGGADVGAGGGVEVGVLDGGVAHVGRDGGGAAGQAAVRPAADFHGLAIDDDVDAVGDDGDGEAVGEDAGVAEGDIDG